MPLPAGLRGRALRGGRQRVSVGPLRPQRLLQLRPAHQQLPLRMPHWIHRCVVEAFRRVLLDRGSK